MQLDYRQIDQYASGGVLLDLGTQQKTLRTSEIEPGLLATGSVNGKQYAIPQGRGTETVVYDSRRWKEACRGAADARTAAGPGTTGPTPCASCRRRRPASPARTDPGQSEDAFEVWLRGQGKALYTKDHELGFTADDLDPLVDLLRQASPGGRRLARRADHPARRLGGEHPAGPAEGRLRHQLGRPVQRIPRPRSRTASPLAPMPSGADGTPGQYFKPSMFLGRRRRHRPPQGRPPSSSTSCSTTARRATILGATRGIPANESIRKERAPS